MIRILPLASVPPADVARLLDRVFGPDRLLRTAQRVRDGAEPIHAACLAALLGSKLVGSVAVHRVDWQGADGSVRPLAWLGPLARDPERVGEGIGAALMAAALLAVDALPLPIALIGDAPYYDRWGFRAEGTGDWALPGPVDRARLLLRTADRPALSGPARVPASSTRQSA